MTFDLLWIDIIPYDMGYGMGIFGFKNWKADIFRNLLAIYYSDGIWIFNIFWMEWRI